MAPLALIKAEVKCVPAIIATFLTAFWCHSHMPMDPSRSIFGTVAVVDLVAYSSLARMLEQNTGASAVADLNRQIQAMVHSALGKLSSVEAFSKIAETGDGAILLFHTPSDAHLFAEQLHLVAEQHNRIRTEQSASRKFRVGIATGELRRESQESENSRFAGIAISDAVRLQTAAQPGEIVIDLPTFAILPESDRRSYGPETIVHGKRSETFRVRKYRVVSPGRSTPLKPHHIPPWLTALGTVAASVVAGLGLWLHYRAANPPAHPVNGLESAMPILQRIQVKPNVVQKGGRITVTVELDRVAPKGGVSVDLSSSDPAILTVDGNALVPQGQTMGTGYSQAIAVPTYPSPIAIVAAYNNETRRADVNVLLSPEKSRVQSRNDSYMAAPTSHIANTISDSKPPSSAPAPKPVTLEPELLSRLEDAQGRLSAENGYWNGVRKTMPPGSSIRPEITSQIYAAEASSQRCEKDKQSLNAAALATCIDSLNDHLNQLKIQH